LTDRSSSIYSQSTFFDTYWRQMLIDGRGLA